MYLFLGNFGEIDFLWWLDVLEDFGKWVILYLTCVLSLFLSVQCNCLHVVCACVYECGVAMLLDNYWRSLPRIYIPSCQNTLNYQKLLCGCVVVINVCLIFFLYFYIHNTHEVHNNKNIESAGIRTQQRVHFFCAYKEGRMIVFEETSVTKAARQEPGRKRQSIVKFQETSKTKDARVDSRRKRHGIIKTNKTGKLCLKYTSLNILVKCSDIHDYLNKGVICTNTRDNMVYKCFLIFLVTSVLLRTCGWFISTCIIVK